MENIIEIKNLSKSFKEIKAVDNLSFCVKKGELFAFLGVNGAGKSTTISIMCGQLKQDSGTVLINNKNINESLNEIKNELGVVFQNNVLDKALTVYDNLKYRASFYNMSKEQFEENFNNLASLLDFRDLKNRVYGKLSGGQRRRVDIARALIHNPQILILDEPTTGLDPQTRKLVWSTINKFRKERLMTVLLTTHYMEETTEADYVVILNKGKIVAEGTPLDLKNKYTGDFIYLYNTDISAVKQLNKEFQEIPNGFKIEVSNTSEATNLIANNPNIFKDYEVIKGKMDDVFLNATGIKLGGE